MLPFNPEDLSQKSLGRQFIADSVTIPSKALARFYKKATPATFRQDYNAFIDAYPNQAKAISDLKPDGIGPGELIAYLVFDNISLGGKKASIDIHLEGKPFAEMKAGAYCVGQHSLIDFKITRDGDQAVTQLARDLEKFNDTYRKITKSQLSHWNPGQAPLSVLREWRAIDLKRLARRHAGPIKEYIDLRLDVNGVVSVPDTNIEVTHRSRPGWEQDVAAFMQSKVEIPVDNSISSLKKIERRWVNQAFKDYLEGKQMALVNTKTLEMMYFGKLTKDMVGLHRIGRNQPKAYVSLPP